VPIIKAMTKLHQFAIMCAPTMAQEAAIAALSSETDAAVQDMVEEYDARRRMLLGRLEKMGVPCFEPKGAFYIFPNIGQFGLSSDEFCSRLLYDYKCAIVPGNAFGAGGEGFARISYAYSIKHITQALERIESFVKSLK
jgi:aminotransferase